MENCYLPYDITFRHSFVISFEYICIKRWEFFLMRLYVGKSIIITRTCQATQSHMIQDNGIIYYIPNSRRSWFHCYGNRYGINQKRIFTQLISISFIYLVEFVSVATKSCTFLIFSIILCKYYSCNIKIKRFCGIFIFF